MTGSGTKYQLFIESNAGDQQMSVYSFEAQAAIETHFVSSSRFSLDPSIE